MSAKRTSRSVPLTSARVSAVASVALVLVLIGVVGLAAIAGGNVAADVQSRLGFTAVLAPDVSEAGAAAVRQRLTRAPYTEDVAYATREAVMQRWQQLMGDDESVDAMLEGINPFGPEVEVTVRPQYAHPDSLRALAARLELSPDIDRVVVNADVAEAVNDTVRRVAWVLGAIALLLLCISIILINNTVRLTIYARRFLINTMQLVGATGGTIRRPFVGTNVVNGIIAAIVAAGVLAGLLWYARESEPALQDAVPWWQAGVLGGALLVLGVAICAIAALFAVNKYLRTERDELYMK